MANYTYLREGIDKDSYLSIERYAESDIAETMCLFLSKIYKSDSSEHETHYMVIFRLFVLLDNKREDISYQPNRSVINITVVIWNIYYSLSMLII